MDSPQFNVLVDGTVLHGFDTGAVLLQLQQQLKLPEAKAQLLIAGKVVTVKRGVDAAIANTYCKRLQAIGVSARVETVVNVAADTAAPQAKPKPTPAITRYHAQRYFPDSPLNAGATAHSSTFKRAVMRASSACVGTLLAYCALALAGVGFLLFYVAHYAYLLATPPILFSATVYLICIAALTVIVALLLRPLLPRRDKAESAEVLSIIQEPDLFAFVTQLCEKLALKAPEQMALTTATVNTASLLPGFKNLARGDYQLTLSLPILENSTLSQFAGLLAADLATQAQLPMLRYRRLAHIICTRLDDCLAHRDWLARHVDVLSLSPPAKLAAVIRFAKQIIEKTNSQLRKIKARMQRIDTQLLRSRLFEQDRYSALTAGSNLFTGLMIFCARLDIAAHDANAKNLEDRIEGGLVDDLPALITHYFDNIDENFARTMQRKWDTETTPRRDEPPLVRERIEQIAGTIHSGLIDDNQPALSLLRRRDDLAKNITLDKYREAGVCFDADRLLPVDELTYAATQDILQRQQAAIYFNDWFKPFRFWSLADYKLIRDMPLQDAAMQLGVCVNEIRRLTPDRAKSLAEYDRLQNQLREILLAQHVLAAGKKFAFRYISYDGTTLVPLLDDRQQELTAAMEKLSQQEAVMGGRITLGLRLSGQAEREVQALHDALRLLHESGTRLHKLSLDCFQLEQLLQRQYQLREADYSLPIKKLETKIDDATTLMIVRLKDVPYPLDSRHSSLKGFVEATLAQPVAAQRSPILQRAQRLLDVLYRVNEKLSRQAADYGTIAEEAYRIEPIRLINNE